jgi:tetratricopeptide (TPR) repeat protein
VLEKAAWRLKEGDPEKAEALYRRALEYDPRQPRVLHWLGLHAHTQGRDAEAIALMERARDLGLDDPPCRFHLAEVRRAAGETEAAVTDYRAALSAGVDTANLFFGLGTALLDLQRFEEARSALECAVRLAPDDVEAHNNLGNALAALGEPARAIGHYRQAIAHDPQFGPAQRNLGLALLEVGDIEHAERALRAAVKSDPRDAEGWRQLARVLRRQAQYREALDAAKRATTLAPHEHAASLEVGNVLRELERFEEAAAWYRKASELSPDAEAHLNIGVCLQSLGRFDEATAAHERALALRPDLAEAHYNLAMIKGGRSPKAQVEQLQTLIARPGLSERERSHALFALGSIMEANGDLDGAFEHYRRGNELRARGMGFDPQRHLDFADRLIATFDEGFFATRRGLGEPSDVPIFILGMPRSGTSLVEQILACHPEVHGAGELDHMRQLVRALPDRLHTEQTFPDCARLLDGQHARQLAVEYLDVLRRCAPTRRVIDKATGNYLRLGLIALLLPNARVIHCRRDPLDTCLSCYFQNFAHGLSFTYDLGHLGLVYRHYVRLMDHWRAVLPNPILDLDYEALIADQERESRRLVDFCGLAWDPRCLRFHEHGRPVRTASFWQVRQPLYDSAVGRWRPFARHLSPLFEALHIAPEERG